MSHGLTAGLSWAADASHRLQNLAWERRLGISTRGVVEVDHEDSSHYAAMHYASINRTLGALALAPDDVFVDVGSGMGRVLCCAARSEVSKVVGVDLSADLCEVARRNARQARGLHAPIEVCTGYADEFDYSHCTAIFMFSPFGADTMRKVLAKIHADRDERPVRIAYANPAFLEPFDELGWLERYAYWDHAERCEEHSVAFYRTAT